MGAIHTKVRSGAGSKSVKVIPERRNYRGGQRKEKKPQPVSLKEVDSLNSMYSPLSYDGRLSTRASTPCLSISGNKSLHIYNPQRGEVVGTSSPSAVPFGSPISWDRKARLHKEPPEGTGNVRHSSFSASDRKCSRITNSNGGEKSTAKFSGNVAKLVHFERKSVNSPTASTPENRDSRSQGDDSSDATYVAAPYDNLKLQTSTTTYMPSVNKTQSSFQSIPQKETVFACAMADTPKGDAQKLIEIGSNVRVKIQKQTPRPYLAEKPPTPPPKPCQVKQRRTTAQSPNLRFRSCSNNGFEDRAMKPVCMRQTPSPIVKHRYASPRSSSLPRSLERNQWACISPNSPRADSPLNRGRFSSTSQHSVTETNTDRSQSFSRIEYTFYINDNEACQRPFYDKRVEAIARATQCNVCLHKPPPGHKPVFYKGMRVLPVTISARTMVSLKRCIARLDTQYPYFNAKAFCPPDMY